VLNLTLVRSLADLTSAAFLRTNSSSLTLPDSTVGRDPSNAPLTQDVEDLNQIYDIINRSIRDGVQYAAFTTYSWIVFAHQWPSTQPHLNTDDIIFLSTQSLEELASQALDTFRVLDWVQEISVELRNYYKGTADAALDDHLRELILGLLSYSVEVGFVPYGQDMFQTLISILDSERSYLDSIDTRLFSGIQAKEVVTMFIQPFLSNAQSRFPYESTPYIRLMRCLFMLGSPGQKSALPMFDYVMNLKEFTELLPTRFDRYEQVEEEYQDPDRFLVVLRDDLPIFISRNGNRLNSSSAETGAMIPISFDESQWQLTSGLPAHTQGEVRNNERPLVVSWNTEYRPLAYLVDCLSTAVPGSNHLLYSHMSQIDAGDIVDIIKLLATVLQASYQNAAAEKSPLIDLANELLRLRFAELDHEPDVITVVYEIFEYNLQRQKTEKDSATSTEILSVCMEFFHAMTYFAPARIWPILVRSRLLDLSGSEPALATVVTNSEILRGDFSFLLRSVKLFDALIDLAYTQPQGRGSSTKRALSRLATSSTSIQFVVPPKTIRTVMNIFLDVLANAFQSCQFWRFANQTQLTELNISLMAVFNKILKIVYGFDEELDLEKKFSSTLVDCAKKLVTDLLVAQNTSSPIAATILGIVFKPPTPLTMGYERQHRESVAEIEAALRLCDSILRIAGSTDCETSWLEAQLFKAAPVLARLYTFSSTLKISVSKTMDMMLSASARNGASPSLLGHMGAETAKCFLSLLTQLNQPLENIDRDLATWNLLSRVVSSQQQWFALYLLTGRTPRESGSGSHTSSETVLQFVLNKLSSISSLPWQKLKVPVAMLNFVYTSYSQWRITVKPMREHKTFLPSMIEYFSKLRREESRPLRQITESSAATLIAGILTMHLYNCREIGDFKFATSLVNKLGYFKNYGFLPPKLNTNQQSFLKKNLKGIYGGFELPKVKHTGIFPVEYGENYFYDYTVATKLIESAKGKGDHRGFAVEIQWANINLSELDAQINLQAQCKLLAIELAQVVARDPGYVLVDPLLDVVRACCVDMRNTTLPDEAADKFQKSQIELVAVILQKLVGIKQERIINELIGLFADLWRAIYSSLQSFDSMYSGVHAEINRTFLKILFLSLQPMARGRSVSSGTETNGTKHVPKNLLPKYVPELVTITTEIIPKGFKSLAELAHDESTTESIQTSDFVLLTSIFQTVLKIPGIEILQTQLALNLANSNVSRYAVNLFSWADQLLIDGDPVFGELSILFLLELSSVPAMADSLAAQGILSQLSAANLMSLYTRSNGAGPFDKPPCLHSIWSRGILPLCLNLLDAVGPPVIVEIISFLSQYPKQAERLIRQLANRRGDIGTRPGQSYITVNMAAEAHSMALLSTIVDGLRNSGSAAGNLGEIPPLPWDRSSLREEIDDWLSQRDSLRRHVLPAGEHEVELFNSKPQNPKYENRLEERIWTELMGASECLNGNRM
jgi:nuclear pore complex protein Nup188